MDSRICTRGEWQPPQERRLFLLSSLSFIGGASHPSTPFVELVTRDDGIDVLPRSREINVLEKSFRRHGRRLLATSPTLRAARAGVVLGQSKRQWIGLLFPMLPGALQIPGTGLEIFLRIEELPDGKFVDLVFMRPFVGGLVRQLHKTALAFAAKFLRIETAFAPCDRLDQHGIEMMGGGSRSNQTVILLKTRRTDPLEQRVNRIARARGQISEAGAEGEQDAKDQLEGK